MPSRLQSLWNRLFRRSERVAREDERCRTNRGAVARTRRRFLFEPLEDRRVFAVNFIDPNPAPGNQFGHTVVPLSSGNVVITAPFDDAGGFNAGAVYLFNGSTGDLISTLRGTHDFDLVGHTGVTALANGNFVVSSASWRNNGFIVGAVTWGSGTTGVNGVVSASNSLVGSTSGDSVGATNSVVALPNGNYLVVSPAWDNGSSTDGGAVTFGNGATGISGTISSSNSLVGAFTNDQVGSGGVKVLSNGSYLVTSTNWSGTVGAVTWVSSGSSLTGAVSSSNSLVGSSSGDEIGSRGILELTNGNFVVMSPNWNNGSVVDAGAATWVSGTAGLTGAVSAANSLVGSSTNDFVGQDSGVALTNGNYVVTAPFWNGPGGTDSGAAVWGSGTTGIKGTISSANALIGARNNDLVGYRVVALTNGNYVVNSPNVGTPTLNSVGAVTWGNGTTGSTGTVSISNSLMGSVTDDLVGSQGVVALSNGNYVVASKMWDNSGVTDAGAVTWGSGTSGITGAVSSSNSLVGSTSGDLVGYSGVVALTNGNYVVGSPLWKSGGVSVGAVTWRNGTANGSGVINAANSLVGSTLLDSIGDIGNIKKLTNGNYVVLSPYWNNGSTVDAGAATWGSGTTGVSGAISSANSLVGGSANDNIGSQELTTLPNGNYVVTSTRFDNGSVVDAGAVTWANGTTGRSGVVSAANSLVGSSNNDQVGLNGVTALSNGNYVVTSMVWDSGSLADAGAVTWATGTAGISGPVNAPTANHVKGLTAGTEVQPIVVDNTNGKFYARFIKESGGVVRTGSQTQGFDAPIVSTLTAAFSGANLVITDVDGAGKDNVLTVSRVNVSGVDYYQFADPLEAFATAPITTPASLLSNNNRTLRVPVSAIGGSTIVNLQGGNDTLQLDLNSGDVVPSGGVQFNGGSPTSGTGDKLILDGGAQGNATYTYTNNTDGSVAMTSFGTVSFTGLESGVVNRGTVSDMLAILPPVSANVVTFADDGTTSNQISRLSGSTIATTDFTTPTGLLTLQRGNVGDTVTFNDLPDFTAGLAIGTAPEPMSSINFAGAFTLAANKNLTAYAAGTISLSTSSSDLSLTGAGVVSFNSTRNIAFGSGASLTTAAGPITLDANQQPVVTTGDFVGISFNNADVISATGNVLIRGRGGNGGGGSQHGVQILAGSDIGLGTTGTVSVIGTGGNSVGNSNIGVLVSGAGAVVTSTGGPVSVTGTGGGSSASSGNFGVSVDTNGQITTAAVGTVTVNGTGGAGNGTNSGVSVSGTGARITSNSGNVSVIGTATGTLASSAGVLVAAAGTITAGSTGAVTVSGTNNGTGVTNVGVQVTGSTSSITSGGGNVSVTGLGGGTLSSTQGYGVFVSTSGVISAGGTGTVTVNGTGRNTSGTGGQNHGVMVATSNAKITSSGGNISITGTGGGGSGSGSNFGVSLATGGQVTGTTTAAVSITGTGGNGSGGLNHGVSVSDTSSVVSVAAGGLSILGTVGSTSGSATFLASSGSLNTSSGGAATITGDSLSIDATATVTAAGTVTIKPKTAATTSVSLGGADAANTLGLTDTELDRVTASLVQIGDATTGPISTVGTITHANHLALVTGAGITIANPITLNPNRNFTGTAVGTILFSAASGDLATSGTGTINLTTARDVRFTTGSSAITVDGSLSISANQQTVSTNAAFKGIEIVGGTVRSTGTGNVTLSGRGGAATGTNNLHGVHINGAGSLVTSGSGNVLITGTGGSSPTSHGVYVTGSGTLSAGNSGTVTVNGFGGASQFGNAGVAVDGTNSRITSTQGTVNVTGQGGGSTGSSNFGVWLTNSGMIAAAGSGATNVTGFGGGLTGGSSTDNYGVSVSTSAQISAAGGTVHVVGTGGGGADATFSGGVDVESAGVISALGVGDLTVEGYAGNSTGTGGGNRGITVGGSGSMIATAGSSITLIATGAGGSTTGGNKGLFVTSGGVVNAGGAGNVTITATGGAGDLNGNHPVDVLGTGSQISSGDGLLSIAATITDGSTEGVKIDTGALATTGTGSVSISSNSLNLVNGGTINAGANGVTLQPNTAGIAVNLGATDAPGVLGLTDAELDAVTAGTLNLGSTTCGVLTLSAAITRSSATAMNLLSGGAINFTTGSLNSAGGNVNLNPGTHISPATSGVDITSGSTGTVSVGNSDDLLINIVGLAPDTQAPQLNVAGRVNLTNTDLVVTGGLSLAGGEIITIINNDGTDAIVGTFNGLAQGATLSSNFLGTGLSATISYTGGTGNDAVIIIGNPPGTTNVEVLLGNLIITDQLGGNTNDTLTISRAGNNVRITDPNNRLEPGTGATAINANTVEIPFASIAGFLKIDTLGGNDSLTIDYSSGNPIPSGGLTFLGGEGADSLWLTGGTTTSVVHTVITPTIGSLAISGMLAGNINYTDVEPITDALIVADRTYLLNAGTEAITLVDAAGANNILSSPLGWNITFANPNASLTIDAADGDDTFDLQSIDTQGPYSASLTIQGGDGNDAIVLNADIQFAAGRNLDLDLQNDSSNPGLDSISIAANVNLSLAGTGTATLKASRNVSLASGSSVVTANGNLVVEANQQQVFADGTFSGVSLVGATLAATGSGGVTVRGRGGNGFSGQQYGVLVSEGSAIRGGTVGITSVVGTGGSSLGSQNEGVRISGANSQITSLGGDVEVVGTGGGSGATSTNNRGVELESDETGLTVISAGGAGTVTVVGTGSNTRGSAGIRLAGAGALITSNGGDVEVNGQGGNGSTTGDTGVWISGGTITSGTDGSVSVTGGGGASTLGSSPGVLVESANVAIGLITSGGGSILITGTGGSGSNSGSAGVYLAAGGAIEIPVEPVLGSEFTITGTGGTSAAGGNVGLLLNGTLNSPESSVTLTGNGGIGTASYGINIDQANITLDGSGALRLVGTTTGSSVIAVSIGSPNTSTIVTHNGNGDIEIVADRVRLESTASLSAASGTVRFLQQTANRLINIGSTVDTTANTLEISAAELDTITAANLQFGNSASGALTVSAPITRVDATNFNLQSAAAISFAGGSLDSAGGNVTLNAGTTVSPATAGVDVAMGTTGTLLFGIGDQLVFNLTGPAVDTQYQQLNVAGFVNLTGVVLVITGSPPASTDDSFILINNDGSDLIAGTFDALPEGSIIDVNGASRRISYLGGDGNDVVILKGNLAPTLSAISDVTISEDAAMQTVNLAGITAGGPESQALQVTATSDNLLLIPNPTVNYTSPNSTGSLSFTPVANQFGTAQVTVTVRDAGPDGTLNTIDDATVARSFTVIVNPINDRPTFTLQGDQGVVFNGGPQTVANFASSVSPGPNETGQSVTFNVGVSNPGLFTQAPSISPDGTLTYTVGTGLSGSSTVTVVAQDSGGTGSGGLDTSLPQTFTITVGPEFTLRVSSFTQTSTGFVVEFNRPLNVNLLNLYDTQGGGIGPADVVLTRTGTPAPLKGTLIVDPNNTKITFVATSGILTPGNYTATLRATADAFVDTLDTILDGDFNNVPGGNSVNSFTVSAASASAVSIGIANFARGPQQPVNVPGSATTGIPLTLTNGQGILSAQFQIRYNPALLNITGATIAPGMPAGTSVVLFSFQAGVAEVLFSSMDPLPANITRFIDVQANVPSNAPYRAKQLLDITNIVLNDNIPAIDDDGVQVVTYFGDANGDGLYNSSDASRVSRLAVGLDTGSPEFQLADPTIIADINGDGSFTGGDSASLLRRAVATPVPEIPALPLPAVTLTISGPDPKLSIPKTLTAAPGQTLNIPVLIDSIIDLTGNGLDSADLLIYYDPLVMDVTGATVGSLLQPLENWQIATRIDPLLGRVYVSLASAHPIEGEFEGELVKLRATIKADAPTGGSAINLAASNFERSTIVNGGHLTLIPAPTNAADDPVDGLLTIAGAPASTSTPTGTLNAGQLVVTGTNGDDHVLIRKLNANQVIVRSNSRHLGIFPLPTSIAVDVLSGRDLVYVDPALTDVTIATDANDGVAGIAADIISASPHAERIASPPTAPQSSSPPSTTAGESASPTSAGEGLSNDLALLQLLDQWNVASADGLNGIRRRR